MERVDRLWEATGGDHPSDEGEYASSTSTKQSTPVRYMRPLRRLGLKEIDELAADYRAGMRVNDLLARFKIDRKTLYKHLSGRGVPLRRP